MRSKAKTMTVFPLLYQADISVADRFSCPTEKSLRISVCIATYQRPERLHALLHDLVGQRLLPSDVVVVDNDALGSAREVVEAMEEVGLPFPLLYDIQPEKNIALTRNRTVELAQGEWLAFVDDDERAPPEWLERLADTALRFEADAVLGPVQPILPTKAQSWLHRGRFYDWPRMESGSVVPVRLMRFGNVLLRARLLTAQPMMFDPVYGLTGGEDGDLLGRLAQNGARIIWCDEAEVREPVVASRLSLRWLLMRSLRGGQDFARHVLAGRHGKPTLLRRVELLLRASVQMVAAALLAILCLPLGRHRSVHWLLKAVANFGKLSAVAGRHYQEYG